MSVTIEKQMRAEKALARETFGAALGGALACWPDATIDAMREALMYAWDQGWAMGVAAVVNVATAPETRRP